MTLIICYVDITKPEMESKSIQDLLIKINEHFLGFHSIKKSIVSLMAEVIL